MTRKDPNTKTGSAREQSKAKPPEPESQTASETDTPAPQPTGTSDGPEEPRQPVGPKEWLGELLERLQEIADDMESVEGFDSVQVQEHAADWTMLGLFIDSWLVTVDIAKGLARDLHHNIDRRCRPGSHLFDAKDQINEAFRIVVGIAAEGERMRATWEDIADRQGLASEVIRAANTFAGYARRQQCQANLEKVMDHLQAYSARRLSTPATSEQAGNGKVSSHACEAKLPPDDGHTYCPVPLNISEIGKVLGLSASAKSTTVRRLLASTGIIVHDLSYKQHLIAIDTVPSLYHSMLTKYMKNVYNIEV